MKLPKPPLAHTLYMPSDEEVHSGVLGRNLREFNYRFAGEYPQVQMVRFNARDAQGELLGGIRGFVSMFWLRVELLWVAEAARGQGVGSALLTRAEQQGRDMGAVGVVLETFDWQAPGFYRKLGYAKSGRIERWVGEHTLWTMTKRFSA
ncbi:MAG: GNAT family N-acetyltransferase [Ramlibacter sp.]|nr:GNAT family N-acetyltransferase [Ramlibacter sp.]